MSNFQFLFACIAASGTLVAGAWIVAQSLNKTRSNQEQFQREMVDQLVLCIKSVGEFKKNPEYDSRFAEGEKRMDFIARQVENLQTSNLNTQTTIAVLSHSMNNMKQRFEAFDLKLDEMPEKIVNLLRITHTK